MIYSIMPLEIILKNDDLKVDGLSEIIELEGIKLEIKGNENGQYIINRIISSDPFDYLNPKFQPGNTIETIYHLK
jgi:hypothetical protein